MKKFMSLMMLVCACLLSQPMQAQKKDITPDDAGYIVKVGDMAPDFEMELTNGQKVKLSVAFAKQTGVTYPLGLDPGADIFAKYADRKAGITRNVLIDKTGRIVMLTRLYNTEEFASLCKKIDEMLGEK